MDGEELWNKVLSKLNSKGEEIQTKTGLWFKAFVKEGKLYIEKATDHEPSSKISKERHITRNDFLFVHSYYDCWMNREPGVRQEVTKKSQNTAYIFALIGRYIDEN